jgi:Zn-dependent protease
MYKKGFETEVVQEDLHMEILEFVLSALILGIAFGVAIAGGAGAFFNMAGLRNTIFQSLIIVAFAFVLHELAHRVVARRFGYKAVYHIWPLGLLFAIGSSLIGFLYASPGAVFIDANGGDPKKAAKQMGITALAGPIVNIVLSILFVGITYGAIGCFRNYLSTTGTTYESMSQTIDFVLGITIIGVEINAWMAVFNLIPFGQFDGYKIFRWSKIYWAISMAVAVGLYVFVRWQKSNFF